MEGGRLSCGRWAHQRCCTSARRIPWRNPVRRASGPACGGGDDVASGERAGSSCSDQRRGNH